jgi:hypothetical protein
MDEKDKKFLEFLLADFSSMKSEIARRSNLQKAVVAAALAFYAWSFQRALSGNVELLVVILAWVVSFLTYTFYAREGGEIRRLGWTIKSKIAVPVGKRLDVRPEEVIPSEAHSSEPNKYGGRKIITNIFNVSLYVLAPLILTFVYFCKSNGT